jgi:hypothetical protein
MEKTFPSGQNSKIQQTLNGALFDVLKSREA